MAHARRIGIIALMLVGCGASTAVQLMGRDPTTGQMAVRITCTRSIDACYERAGEVCRFGFTVANESGHDGPVFAQTHCDAYGNCSTTAAQRFDGALIVNCRRGAATAQNTGK